MVANLAWKLFIPAFSAYITACSIFGPFHVPENMFDLPRLS